MKLSFKDKAKTSSNILTENNQTIRGENQICRISNKYFANVTEDLKLRQ